MLLLALALAAADTWSTPFAGGELLHRVTSNQDAWLLRVDLCTNGIDVRATALGERGRTVGSFSSLVGAKAAINGDFFNGSFGTDGPAMHAGAAWGGGDHGYVAPVAFGAGFVDVPHHANQSGPAAGAREVVSGHPTLLDDNNTVGNPGDPLCTNRHPRTALGVNADHTKLYMVVVDGRRTGAAGMTCNELADFMREHGAFDAVNLDGGGSSTLVVNGALRNRPSDGSQRTTANHLAIVPGAGAPLCPNAAPRGFIDSATCAEGAVGWAQDLDTPDQSIDVHVYLDGPAGVGRGFATTADVHRDDLCSAIGSCGHGFRFPIPPAFHDGAEHTVHAYGIDSEGGHNPLLVGSPLSFTCTPPAPPLAPADGVLRHVTSAGVLGAWALGFDDVYDVDGAVVDAFDVEDTWAPAPRLVQIEGQPEVYVVDALAEDGAPAQVLRHVPDPAAMAAWRFSFDAIEVVAPDSAEAALEVGAPWTRAPFLVRALDRPEVYVLDARAPVAPPPGEGEGEAAEGEGEAAEGEGEGSEGEGEGSEGEGEGEDGVGALPPSVTDGGCAATSAPSLVGFALLALLSRGRLKMRATQSVPRRRT